MSTNGSQQSVKSTSSNRNRTRICAHDGKVESSNYILHARRHHGGVFTEWVPGQPLIGEPWCTNWKETIEDPTIKPVGILPKFQAGVGKQFSQKLYQASGFLRSPSLPALSQYGRDNDAQMENIIEEENKEVAVPQFGNLESNKNLGKRSSQTPLEDLQQELGYQDLPIEEKEESTVKVTVPQSKRNNAVAVKSPALSAKNLNSLPHASLEQKQKIPYDESAFLAPFPMAPTVYVSKGMRDQEAIQKLRVLEQKTADLAQVRVLELIELAPMLAQYTVSSYIEKNKGELLNIKDLLILAQELAVDLSTDKISSIAFASVLFGGSAWVSLPKMFNSLEASKLEDTLSLLYPLLSVKFNQNLAQWVCVFWRYLEEQTLLLLRYLKDQHLEDTLFADIATISRMVQVRACDVTQYITVIRVFSESLSFKLMMDALETSAPQWKSEQKLSFESFCALVTFLMKGTNKYLIKANEEDLAELPLGQWLERLTTLQNASLICDVSSAQHRLIQLCEVYGPLLKSHAIDLCLSGDTRYKRTLHEVPNPPNALQFANSQYAVLSLRDRPRQLWCIPSGQGKSRVLATMTLILLLSSSTTKVHLVFDSRHLMQRDQKEFHSWLKHNNILSVVEYHVGLDFVCQLGDVILIDEADEIILSDPAKFLTKIQHLKCICLTATPDNDDNRGVEREVLKHMGFSFFNGQSDLIYISSSIAGLTQALPFSPDTQLVSYIQDELKEYAVLLYCFPLFLDLLIAADIPFLLMKDGDDINDEFLRTLDNRTGPDGTHTLIVATSSFGMRGFDYRAQKGITLVLAAPFANKRQAMQGLNRVGRFNDPCKRLIAKDVDLIDKDQELNYTTSLIQFMNQHQKHKVVVNLPKEERKQQPPATTTATSTTSTQKPKRQYTKKDKSSQSTITIASAPKQQSLVGMFTGKNLTKRQAALIGGDQNTKKKDDEEIEITANQIY